MEPLPPSGGLPARDALSPVRWVRGGLMAFHEATNLPWWASLSACTLLFRFSILPMTRWAKRAMTNPQGFEQARAQLDRLGALRREHVARFGPGSKKEAEALYRRGLYAIARKQMPLASLGPGLALTAVQVPAFVCYGLAIRDLVGVAGGYGMDHQGLLWFTDLTKPDLVLAMTAVSLSYAVFEVNLPKGPVMSGNTVADMTKDPTGWVVSKLKPTAQAVTIFVLPFTSQFPSGVFMYWIPSHLFSLALSYHNLTRLEARNAEKLRASKQSSSPPPPPAV